MKEVLSPFEPLNPGNPMPGHLEEGMVDLSVERVLELPEFVSDQAVPIHTDGSYGFTVPQWAARQGDNLVLPVESKDKDDTGTQITTGEQRRTGSKDPNANDEDWEEVFTND